jgi:hypothetical protein
MNPALGLEQLEFLRRIDACTLANAVEMFHERWCQSSGLHPLRLTFYVLSR